MSAGHSYQKKSCPQLDCPETNLADISRGRTRKSSGYFGPIFGILASRASLASNGGLFLGDSLFCVVGLNLPLICSVFGLSANMPLVPPASVSVCGSLVRGVRRSPKSRADDGVRKNQRVTCQRNPKKNGAFYVVSYAPSAYVWRPTPQILFSRNKCSLRVLAVLVEEWITCSHTNDMLVYPLRIRTRRGSSLGLAKHRFEFSGSRCCSHVLCLIFLIWSATKARS